MPLVYECVFKPIKNLFLVVLHVRIYILIVWIPILYNFHKIHNKSGDSNDLQVLSLFMFTRIPNTSPGDVRRSPKAINFVEKHFHTFCYPFIHAHQTF